MRIPMFLHKLLKAKHFLAATLAMILFSLAGCEKVAVKDPALSESFKSQTAEQQPPIFRNGDIVCCRMNKNKKGIVMQADYKYVPKLGAWYCVVDFYPSSTLLHLNLSGFDNCQRHHIYEYELELLQSYEKQAHTMPAQWQFMQLEIVQ